MHIIVRSIVRHFRKRSKSLNSMTGSRGADRCSREGPGARKGPRRVLRKRKLRKLLIKTSTKIRPSQKPPKNSKNRPPSAQSSILEQFLDPFASHFRCLFRETPKPLKLQQAWDRSSTFTSQRLPFWHQKSV